MKMMKKVTSLLLAMILIFATFAVSGVGVSAAKYSGSYGGVNWEFDDSTNTMTFSGNGQVDAETVSSYANRTENIVLKSGVYFSSFEKEGFPQLKSISADKNHSHHTTVDGVLFDKEMETICIFPSKKPGSSYTIPDGVVTIDFDAFLNCTELTDIKIPDSVREVLSDSFENSGCWNNSSNWDGNALYIDNCLVYVNYKKGGTPGHYNIRPGTRMLLDDHFLVSYSQEVDRYFNDNLTGLSIPDTVNYISGSGPFAERVSFLSEYAYWFDGGCYIDNCLIAVNEDLSGHFKIKEGTRVIAEGAFKNCKNITAITIPGSVKNIPRLDDSIMGNGVPATDVYINEGVENIENEAFDLFNKLKNIYLPKSLKKIHSDCVEPFMLYGTSTFSYDNMINVSYAGTTAEWGNVEIVKGKYDTDFKTGAIIQCTDGTVNAQIKDSFDSSASEPPHNGFRISWPLLIAVTFVTILFIIAVVIIIKFKKKKKNKKAEEPNKEYKTLQ